MMSQVISIVHHHFHIPVNISHGKLDHHLINKINVVYSGSKIVGDHKIKINTPSYNGSHINKHS